MITSKLTEKLTILQSVISGGTLGEPIQYWLPVNDVYASILNQKGNAEFSNLPGNTYKESIQFWLRHNPNVFKKGNRILYNCESYRIVEVKHIQRNQATIITCESVE